MCKKGKELLQDPDFSVSIKKMCAYIRKPGRQTSLCRYHLEFEHDVDAGRRCSVAATLELVETRASKRNNTNSYGVKRYTLKGCVKLQIDELCASTEV